MIYFVQNQTNLAIKVGYSTNVPNRLAQLQTSSPDRLILLATLEGTMEDERRLHADLAEHRLVGEWFRPASDVIKAVSQAVAAEDVSLALGQYRTETAAWIGCVLSASELFAQKHPGYRAVPSSPFDAVTRELCIEVAISRCDVASAPSSTVAFFEGEFPRPPQAGWRHTDLQRMGKWFNSVQSRLEAALSVGSDGLTDESSPSIVDPLASSSVVA